MTKGHRATRHSLYKRAKESTLHALSYAYAHRRERKGDMRRLWIVRLSAASRAQGLSYGQFIYGLKQAGVDIAVREPEAFARLVTIAKGKVEG
jgi:large subunit ribosomal protein L20